ncbi:hypothetical protein [Streptomyces sp. LARHCF252]
MSDVEPFEEAPHGLHGDHVAAQLVGADEEPSFRLGEHGRQFPDALQESGQDVVDGGVLGGPSRPEHGAARVDPVGPGRYAEIPQVGSPSALRLQSVGDRAGVAEAGQAYAVVLAVLAQCGGDDREHPVGTVVVDEVRGPEPLAALGSALAALARPGDALVHEVQAVGEAIGKGRQGAALGSVAVEEDAIGAGRCRRRPGSNDDLLAGQRRAVGERLGEVVVEVHPPSRIEGVTYGGPGEPFRPRREAPWAGSGSAASSRQWPSCCTPAGPPTRLA